MISRDNENLNYSYLPIVNSPISEHSLNIDIFKNFEFDFSHIGEESSLNFVHENSFLNRIFKIIEDTKISCKYKLYYKNLFNKYFNFFSDKFESVDENATQIILNKNDIFFPNNIYYYFKYILNYKTENLNRACFFCIKILRRLKNDNELNYFNVKFNKRNIKKKIDLPKKKIQKFIQFLLNKNDIKIILIFELIYKFNAHIGGIVRMKVKDISKGFIPVYQKNNGILYFKEKNCYKHIKKYISQFRLKRKDFLFHRGNIENINKSINQFTKSFNNLIKNSNVFDDLNIKKKTSEIFRLFRFLDYEDKILFKTKEKNKSIFKILGESNIITKRIKIFNNSIKGYEKL